MNTQDKVVCAQSLHGELVLYLDEVPPTSPIDVFSNMLNGYEVEDIFGFYSWDNMQHETLLRLAKQLGHYPMSKLIMLRIVATKKLLLDDYITLAPSIKHPVVRWAVLMEVYGLARDSERLDDYRVVQATNTLCPAKDKPCEYSNSSYYDWTLNRIAPIPN